MINCFGAGGFGGIRMMAFAAGAVGMLVGCPGSAAGQDAATHDVLSLRDVLARAVEHSPRYRQAVNEMSLEPVQGRRAWGAFLPSLNLDLGTTQGFSRQTTAFDDFGNPVENPVRETVYSSRSNQAVSVGIDLFRGGSRFHGLAEAKAQAAETRHAGEDALNTVLAEVQREFLQAQRHRALLLLEEELLLGRERDLEVTRRLYDLASKSRSDLLGTEGEVETQRVAVRRTEGDYRKALLALRRAMGDPRVSNFDVDPLEPEVFDPVTMNIEEVVARAEAGSPLVLRARAASRTRQAALSIQRSGRWPTVSLSGGLNRGSFGRDQEALFDLTPDGLDGGLGISVSIPLFRRFETSQQIGQADVEFRNALEETRLTELQVEETVRARYVDLEVAWSTLQESARGLELVEERLRMVREEYRLVAKTFEELQSAVRQAAVQRRTAIEQRFDFATALLDLHEAAGIVAQEAGLADTHPGAN